MTYCRFCIYRVLAYYITIWHACLKATDKGALKIIIDVDQKIITYLLPFLLDISNSTCLGVSGKT